MRALLIDQSRDRSTLVAARCLALAGYTVGTGAWEPSFASISRYARRHHTIRECTEGEDLFIADVAAAVREGGYEIVFCAYEAGLMALSRRREEIAPAVWPYAEHPVVERAFDKLELYHAARAAGLRAPHTEPATSRPSPPGRARSSSRPATTSRRASTRGCSSPPHRAGSSRGRSAPAGANRCCRPP